LTLDYDTTSKSLEEEKRAGSKMKREWEDYRKDTGKALEQLIDLMSND
jgi:hypothetical protein